MKNINIIYCYPDFIKVGTDINLVRIVDENIKETIIIYASVNDSSRKSKNVCGKAVDKIEKDFKINITNTNVGAEINLCNVDSTIDFENVVNKIKENENKIKSLSDLSKVDEFVQKLYFSSNND
ncbi:MAG: hypothetical protein LBN09_08375 [Clostridioides sp.]|nr:hypothetical protein [Clostridioides sp.]